MSLTELDSRTSLGTDIERVRYPDYPKSECTIYPKPQAVRVFFGNLGHVLRMSAPKLDIAVEASSKEEVWAKFLCEARKRDDSAWLTFDVGPTRREEIADGLNASEDENWCESCE